MRTVVAAGLLLGYSLAIADIPRLRVTGSWDSNYGEVSLQQHDGIVTGQYPCCGGGSLEGHVDGTTIYFRWHEPRGAGEGIGVWRLNARTGGLEGSWGHRSDSDGGVWNLVPTRQIAR
jgi:hypothetical protein